MKIDIERAIRAAMPPAEAEIVVGERDRLKAQNARLLEALKAVVVIGDRKHNAWDEARAAIAESETTSLQ